MRRPRLVVLALAAALLALAGFAPSALASKELISEFGTTLENVPNQGFKGSFGGELSNPRDVAVNSAGIVYVADEANNRIERFAANGGFLSAWGKDTIASSINERQRIVVKATAGTYTLSFDGSTTTAIPYNESAFVIQNALTALPTVGGAANLEVSGAGSPENPFVVTFKGALGTANQPTISADTSELTGTIEISTIANGKPSVANDTGTGFETCTVATECKAGAASGENGALDHPQSVAVDPDTDNVYVSDRGNRRIDEFDAGGEFIRAFGFDVVESGPGDTGTGYEVCNASAGDVCKAGVGGSGVGQYGTGAPENGFGIAVSPSDGNVATGMVYLADSGNQRVDTFNLDGGSPSSFGSSATFGSEQPRSVAVDSRGIVYASDSNDDGDVQRYDSQNANGGGVGFLAPIVPPVGEVQKVTFTGFKLADHFTLTCPDGTTTVELTYAESESGLTIIRHGLEEACGAGNVFASGNPPNTTVSFSGDLGGANLPQMTCTKLSGTGSCSVTTVTDGHPGPLASGSTAGLAVNPAGTVLYVLRSPFFGKAVVQQFGPTNEPGLSAAPTTIDDTHGSASGLASVRGFGFNSSSGRLYVSAIGDNFGNDPLTKGHRVYVLADSSSFPNPTASMSLIKAIADRSATFEGKIDPRGGLVDCSFQYSTDEVHWTDAGGATFALCDSLSLNGGEQSISLSTSGLIPGQKYFVRLQVTRPYFSSFIPVTSTSKSFTTATGPPILSGATARAIDEHSVRATATIDPGHSPTAYVVQYGLTPALGSSTAPVQIGEGSSPIEVSQVIGGLSPATQYYFKLVATNLAGSAAGEGGGVATYPSPPSFGPCPNDLLRTGPSAHLPECRAYEQATPTDKHGSDVSGSPTGVQASPSGDGVTFFTLSSFPGTEGFEAEVPLFVSHFVADEWSTTGMLPPLSYGDKSAVEGWTPDLRLSFIRARVTGGAAGYNLVMRDNADGAYTVLVPQGAGFTEGTLQLAGTFEGDSKVVFAANGVVPVASGPAPSSSKGNVYLYNRETGELTLAGLLPDSACGSPPCVPTEGSELPAAFESYVEDGHVLSSSGDVYFTDREAGQLYLRRDAAGPGATTVQVSASERTDCADHDPCNGTPEPDPAGTFKPTFMGATPDGSHAFLMSEQELTDNARTAPDTKDLYRFDAEAPAGEHLMDLAPGAEVVGVLGYSDSGSYVYFAANADLDGGGPAASGNCSGSANELFNHPTGSCSIYLWQADGAGSCASAGGCITLVVRAKDGDGYNWVGARFADSASEMKQSQVTADGRILVLRSQLRLTAYDNQGTSEFYRYEVESGQFTCLTCNPTGERPTDEPKLKTPDLYHAPSNHKHYHEGQAFLGRNLTPDGDRFIFQTSDKLVPADVNGEQACPRGPDPETGAGFDGSPACTDVYEWEAPGEGSCATAAAAYSPANGGCIYLLSTGTGPYPAYLADVSESGDTAFIFSRQQLVPVDEDSQLDLYAVKVDGGLAYQHLTRPAACEGDACRGPSSQPSDAPGAGSGVFEGPGNRKSGTNNTRCPKGKRQVRHKGKVRCVAKRRERKSKRHHKRAANKDRRASR